MRCGNPEAARRGLRKKTGSRPRMNCGARRSSPEMRVRPRGSDSMKRSNLSFFPCRPFSVPRCSWYRWADCCWPNRLRSFPSRQTLAPDQLDDLVAPIALYPDPLVSQILVASTYPLEVVEALQWLQRNPGLTGASLTKRPSNKTGPEHTGLGDFSGPRQTLEPGHYVDHQSGKRVSESAGRRDGRRAAHAGQGAAGREVVLHASANRDHHQRQRATRNRD